MVIIHLVGAASFDQRILYDLTAVVGVQRHRMDNKPAIAGSPSSGSLEQINGDAEQFSAGEW